VRELVRERERERDAKRNVAKPRVDWVYCYSYQYFFFVCIAGFAAYHSEMNIDCCSSTLSLDLAWTSTYLEREGNRGDHTEVLNPRVR